MPFNNMPMFFPTFSKVEPAIERTKTVPQSRICTTTVRFGACRTRNCFILATLIGGISAPLTVSWGADAAAARADSAQRQRAATGWLTLERDQREARTAAGAPDLAQSQRLQALERQERLRYREMLEGERRELDLEQRRARLNPQRPGTEARFQGRLLEQQRAQASLRLRMQLDRQARGFPPPGIPRH